jgi:hypothetical protein
LIGILAVFCLPTAGQADYQAVTFDLTESNTLADSVLYGTVKVEVSVGGDVTHSLLAGQARLTWTALTTPYTSTGTNFGFDKLGFNSSASITASDVSVSPNDPQHTWGFSTGTNMDGFGNFLDVTAKSGSGVTPVTVLISNLGSNATIANFEVLSTGGHEGPGGSDSSDPNAPPPANGGVYFAAHVIDITPGGSQYIGGVTPESGGGGAGGLVAAVPAPPSAVLFGFGGLGFVGAWVWSRRRRVAFSA